MFKYFIKLAFRLLRYLFYIENLMALPGYAFELGRAYFLLLYFLTAYFFKDI
jgi:hypothetical protein